MLSVLLAIAGGVAACAAQGCYEAKDRACAVGADCASGMCRGDGTCASFAEALDAGVARDGGGNSGLDSGPTAESGVDHDAQIAPPVEGGVMPAKCTPNHDGMITRDEVPLAPGLHASYRTAQGATISTAGTAMGDGSRAWDFSGALPGDHTFVVETVSPTGTWFEGDFAGASFTSRMSDQNELLGVFTLTSSAVLLRGEVSAANGLTATKLKNSTEVPALVFPIHAGATWQATTNVTGLAQGVAAAYQEAYASEVDAAGTLVTPFGTFQVLRVKTTLTRTIGVVPTTIRSFQFVTECFGTVATVISHDNEPTTEFTSAAEVERLAP